MNARSEWRWIIGAAAAGLTAWSAVAGQASATTMLAHAPENSLPSGAGSITASRDAMWRAFAYENVLGTHMDLLIGGGSEVQVQWAHRAALAEIDRLTRILSTRDPDSTIAAFMSGRAPIAPEISDLLSSYGEWSARTQGVISPYLGGAAALWQRARATRQVPDDDALRRAVAYSAPSCLNVDALGKAYIVERAVAAAREFASAGLLNIGGDLRAWGEPAWTIGVADPRLLAENATPLLTFPLHEGAVATSSGYLRNVTVAGQTFSHVLDGRTGRAANPRNAATVVARDCLTANAIATACCVVEHPSDQAALLSHPGVRGFLVQTEPTDVRRGGVLAQLAYNGADGAPTLPAAAHSWPSGYAVNVAVNLRDPGVLHYRRPYVSVWIEDAAGRVVRTVSVWGARKKYLLEMSHWREATGDGALETVAAFTRATRLPGQYSVTWDGRDDAGMPMPRGQYTVAVEINREFGHHVVERTRIDCSGQPATAALRATSETDESVVNYGPALDPANGDRT
ncbi:MAG TPA: DUF2271 domain-containing protein [Burkholderiales bacterium]|nr:DUF2271 domain-containing protein [Burkholderiales bacterium]